MTSVSINCPTCGQVDSFQFYEGTENGAPHGEGFWPMPVSDINQDCACEMTDAQITDLMNQAWEPLRLEDEKWASELAQDYLDSFQAGYEAASIWHGATPPEPEPPIIEEPFVCDHVHTLRYECAEDPNEGLPPYAR